MEEGPPSKRPKVSRDDLERLSKEDLLKRLIDHEEQLPSIVKAEVEEKVKQHISDAARTENVLVMRLTTKEQDIQDYLNQINELKASQGTSIAQLRQMLLDPAINLMFHRMKKEADNCKERLEQAQNDLAAWKFTPDSQTGKRLMAKCRMLLQENEELGKEISQGRTAKLEGEIALEKTLVGAMKASQAEFDEFIVDMDEDTEGMQSTIYLLQQQLTEAKEEIARLRGGGHVPRAESPRDLKTGNTSPLNGPSRPEHAYPTDESATERTEGSMTSDDEQRPRDEEPAPRDHLEQKAPGEREAPQKRPTTNGRLQNSSPRTAETNNGHTRTKDVWSPQRTGDRTASDVIVASGHVNVMENGLFPQYSDSPDEDSTL